MATADPNVDDLPKQVVVPRVLNPEIVPGGTLTGHQMRQIQDALKDGAQALNQTLQVLYNLPAIIADNTPPPPQPQPVWAGQALLITSEVRYDLEVMDNFIYIGLGGTSGTPSTPTLQFHLPQRSTATGPFFIMSGDDVHYTLYPFGGDTFDFPDLIQSGADMSSTNVVEVYGGVDTGGCTMIVSPKKNADTVWIVAQMDGTGWLVPP